MSGLPIRLPKAWRDRSHTASLDRIDSSLGYTIGNVQWVHKHVNVMKNIYPQNMFLFICCEVAKNNNNVNFSHDVIDNFKFGMNEKYRKKNRE